MNSIWKLCVIALACYGMTMIMTEVKASINQLSAAVETRSAS